MNPIQPPPYMAVLPVFGVIQPVPNGPRNYPLQILPGMGLSIVLLTEELFLERYRAAYGLSDGKYETIRLDKWTDVLVFLMTAPPQATHVTLDPPDPPRDWKHTYPIKSLIQELEEFLQSPADRDPDGPPREA